MSALQDFFADKRISFSWNGRGHRAGESSAHATYLQQTIACRRPRVLPFAEALHDLSRVPLRDLMALGGGERWFDDPWIAVDHLDDLWGYFAGLPPEADKAPDATWRGWMRLVTPEKSDANRSRWGTDPNWRVVQRAKFGDAPPVPLQRIPAVRHDLSQVDAELCSIGPSPTA